MRSAGNPDVLTLQQLQQHPELTAFEFVQQWRPLWLRPRRGDINVGTATGLTEELQSERGIRVYVDGAYQGDGTNVLNRLWVSDLRQMEWLDASEASQRFGTGHSSGAILVNSRQGRR